MGIAGDNLHFERRQCGASGYGYWSDRIRWAWGLDGGRDLVFRPALRPCSGLVCWLP